MTETKTPVHPAPEIVKEPTPLVNVPAVQEAQPDSLLHAIIRASSDAAVDVSKMEAMMRMKSELEDRQAKRDFAEAFNRVAGKMPRVKKNGTIELKKDGVSKGSLPFARWEDMDAVVRPIITDEGFSLSFDTAPRVGGGLTIKGELLHVSGHSRTASIDLPSDVGPGRNALQAMGSTVSYGKRYCAEMLLNIVREGQDDDGTKGGAKFIKGEQVEELQKLIAETGTDEQKYLSVVGVVELGEIPLGGFVMAKNMLLSKRRANAPKIVAERNAAHDAAMKSEEE